MLIMQSLVWYSHTFYSTIFPFLVSHYRLVCRNTSTLYIEKVFFKVNILEARHRLVWTSLSKYVHLRSQCWNMNKWKGKYFLHRNDWKNTHTNKKFFKKLDFSLWDKQWGFQSTKIALFCRFWYTVYDHQIYRKAIYSEITFKKVLTSFFGFYVYDWQTLH